MTIETCAQRDCDEPRHPSHKRTRLCREHFNAAHRKPGARPQAPRVAADGTPFTCSWGDGCPKKVHAGGFCNAHYQAQRKGGYRQWKECPIPECGEVISEGTGFCKKHTQFAWRYSLSYDEMVALYSARVCGNPGCDAIEGLHLDHDHACCPKDRFGTSHKVACGECNRGWLCKHCNWALGNMGESAEKLRGLADYSEAPPRVRNP